MKNGQSVTIKIEAKDEGFQRSIFAEPRLPPVPIGELSFLLLDTLIFFFQSHLEMTQEKAYLETENILKEMKTVYIPEEDTKERTPDNV